MITSLLAAAVVVSLGFWNGRAGSKASTDSPQLLALAVPGSVVAGERISLFGGMLVPAGSFEIGTFSCQGGSCARSLWRRLEGPGEVWGGFGSVTFEEVRMPATVELRLFEAEGLRESVVASWQRPVSVVSASVHSESLEDRSITRAGP